MHEQAFNTLAPRMPRTVRRGFTLVELVAAMVVVAALGSVVSGVLFTATDGYTRGATTAQLHGDASVALDRIMREIANIPLDESAGDRAPDVDSVSASSITWGSGSALSLSGTTLNLAIDGGAAQPLLTDVTAFEVQTYNESNTALGATLSGSACDPVRRVRITLTLARNGVSETLRTRVFLRCMMAPTD